MWYSINMLKFMLKIKGTITLPVTGNSMIPCICNKDEVVITKNLHYSIGDILVFEYTSGELIMHRLLMAVNNKFICKGDNSFRIEEIEQNKVIGKVILVKRGKNFFLPNQMDKRYIRMSLKIGLFFIQQGYKVLESEIFREYKTRYLNQ